MHVNLGNDIIQKIKAYMDASKMQEKVAINKKKTRISLC